VKATIWLQTISFNNNFANVIECQVRWVAVLAYEKAFLSWHVPFSSYDIKRWYFHCFILWTGNITQKHPVFVMCKAALQYETWSSLSWEYAKHYLTECDENLNNIRMFQCSLRPPSEKPLRFYHASWCHMLDDTVLRVLTIFNLATKEIVSRKIFLVCIK